MKNKDVVLTGKRMSDRMVSNTDRNYKKKIMKRRMGKFI